MNNLISKIIKGEGLDIIIENIMNEFFLNGPVNTTNLEILSYIKLYQPDVFEKYEDDILYLMGLFFKNNMHSTENLKSLLFEDYKNAVRKKYNETFTPVQANIVDNICENSYFSFSSATSTGKSFVFRKLITEEVNDIAIVVPSRALINEYYLKVNEIIKDKKTNILTFPYIINTKNAVKNIFILTPERTKELFKIKDRINLKLVLFDEAQIGDEDSTRGILFDSIVRRINKNFGEAKLLFAHPYIENPVAQLEKNMLVDKKYNAKNYNYKNVGQIFICVDKNFNYYHFGINKNILGNNKINMDYDPIKKCILNKGTVLVYTSKASIYNANILEHMSEYIDLCSDLEDEEALKLISKIKDIMGGSINEKSSTYSKLLKLLKKGIVIHHGSLPLAVRLLVEKFTQLGFCRICFATSTLYQGINMPFDIVYIKRFEAKKNLLIKNLIGRAGRSTAEKKFDFGQIIVSVDNMSDLRNCLKETNIISNESKLDTIDESDDAEIIEFKDAIKNNTFNDDYNMTETQLQKLNENNLDESIVIILDYLLKDGKFVSSEEYYSLSDEIRLKIMQSFEKIYTKHLSNRELTDAEKEILHNAIRIFVWQINGKKFKEIVGYRFSYITRMNERNKILNAIEKEKNLLRKSVLVKAYNDILPRFTIAAAQLPNKNIPCFNMLSKIKAEEVSYDLIMYDTYDYLDKVWGFCLIDVFYAAFHLYFIRTQDERANLMAKYIKYSTIDDIEIWLLKYGFDFEDMDWIKPCIDKIDESSIVFNKKINELDEEKITILDRYN